MVFENVYAIEIDEQDGEKASIVYVNLDKRKAVIKINQLIDDIITDYSDFYYNLVQYPLNEDIQTTHPRVLFTSLSRSNKKNKCYLTTGVYELYKFNRNNEAPTIEKIFTGECLKLVESEYYKAIKDVDNHHYYTIFAVPYDEIKPLNQCDTILTSNGRTVYVNSRGQIENK